MAELGRGGGEILVFSPPGVSSLFVFSQSLSTELRVMAGFSCLMALGVFFILKVEKSPQCRARGWFSSSGLFPWEVCSDSVTVRSSELVLVPQEWLLWGALGALECVVVSSSWLRQHQRKA